MIIKFIIHFVYFKIDANVIDAKKYVKRLADRLSPIVLPIAETSPETPPSPQQNVSNQPAESVYYVRLVFIYYLAFLARFCLFHHRPASS